MELIVFLLVAPIINIIILIIIACCNADKNRGGYGGDGPIIMSPENHSAPIEEGYKDDTDIADKIDGRLTNITKNPWKEVL